MKQGKALLEQISNWLLIIVFGIIIISIFIPEGKGLPIMFIAVIAFFAFPLIESLVTMYNSLLYRNSIIGKGYMDQERDTWEKFKWRIIKVIPLVELPERLHNHYKDNIDIYYKDLIRDRSLEEVNKRFTIDETTLEVKPKMDFDAMGYLKLEDKQKIKSHKDDSKQKPIEIENEEQDMRDPNENYEESEEDEVD
jgi:hypothetical protein